MQNIMADSRQTVVAFLTLSSDSSVDAFVNFIDNKLPEHNCKCVRLSNNDLESFQIQELEEYNAVVLLHSVQEGRNSVTDVPDAKYNNCLPELQKKYGTGRVAVIVYSMTSLQQSYNKYAMMLAFRRSQPTTFICSGCVIQCNNLLAMDDEYQAKLISFLENVPNSPLPVPDTGPVGDERSNQSGDETHSLSGRQMKVTGTSALLMSTSVQTLQVMSSPIAKASVFVCGDVTAAAKAVTALGKAQTIILINEDSIYIKDNQSSAAVQFAVVVSGKQIRQTVLFIKDHRELSRFFINNLTNEGDTVLDDIDNDGDLAHQANLLKRVGKIFKKESEEGETEGGVTEEGEAMEGEAEGGVTEGGEANEGETEGGVVDREEAKEGETEGGVTEGGETNEGETEGGVVDRGEAKEGETEGGVTEGGETNEGETEGGVVDREEAMEEETEGGVTEGGETNEGETEGGVVDRGEAKEGETEGGVTGEGETNEGETEGGVTEGGEAMEEETEGGVTEGGKSNEGETEEGGVKQPTCLVT